MSGFTIDQVDAQFLPEEDRLLIRVNTKENQQYRFLFTRRYVQGLWPSLLKAMGSDPEVVQKTPASTPQSEQTKSAVMSFKHEATIQKAQSKKKFVEKGKESPWGTEGVLLSKVSLQPNNKGGFTLGIHDKEGKGLQIESGNQLLHFIYRLLIEGVAAANWGLVLPTFEKAAGAEKPKKLN